MVEVMQAPSGFVAPPRVEFEELRTRARALGEVFRERAAQTEQDRRVSAESMQMLREAGLFKLMQPARFGGFEYGFTELVNISTEIGRGCASTAWCYGLVVIHQWLLAVFAREAHDEVESANPGAIVAGSYAPQARASAANGGYRIKGRWTFASNCDNASWLMLGGLFPSDEGEGNPVPAFFMVPAGDCTIDDDWFTVGLAGTGSKNIVIGEDVFIPKHRVLPVAQLMSNPPGILVNKNPVFRIPFLAGIPVALVSPAIGTVQGALDEFIDMAAGRVTRGAVQGSGNKMAEFQSVQIKVAEAAAYLDAAKLMLTRDTGEVERVVARGETVSVDMRIRNRRDQAFAVKLTTNAADALYSAVGGGGLYLSSGVQRAWRDAHAVAKHVSLNWDWVGSMYGQHRLGLKPVGQF